MMTSPAPPRKVRKGSSGQNIKVFVRCRPMNALERNSKSTSLVDCQNNKEIVIRERPTDKFAKTFTFDRVFGPDSKQIDVYKSVAKNCVEEVLSGFNCTIFAYGQTGTGKTFTMEGEHTQDNTSWDEDPLAGIIPRCVNHLFDELRMQKLEFTMRVSFLELYNEELFDLLSAHDDMSKLRMYEDATRKGSCIIQGLEEVLVRSKSDVYSVMEKGSAKRQTAATLMNAHSSRSHTVFTVTVHIKENTVDGDELLKTGKLHLVDLAGSENIGRSGAVDKRAREAGNINMSLLTLGRVITSLVEKAPHVPYRESKLTRLLQDALGGRTKTSVIATISPASVNLEETLSTLDYAHRAKNIQNKPEVNQKLNKKELIGEYTVEIERLRRDLMAMREKNGVYLAHENYQDMINTMETQAQEITEKIGHIRALEEEIEKKKEMFLDASRQLKDTCEELRKTENKLYSTQNNLDCTQKLLHNTAQERDEQKFLVSAHMEVEEKLKAQGRTLVNVAETTTGDISKLFNKLDRKNEVENKNRKASEEFQQSYRKCIDVMRADLKSAVAEQSEAAHTLSSQLDDCMKKYKKEVMKIGDQFTILGENQKTLINTFLTIYKNKVEDQVTSTQAVNDQVCQDCTHQQMLTKTFHDNEAIPMLDKLASLISSNASTIAKLPLVLNSKISVIDGECEKVHQQQSNQIVQLEHGLNTFMEVQSDHIKNCLAAVNNLTMSTETRSQNMASKISAVVDSLLDVKQGIEEFRSTSSEGFTDIHSNLNFVQEHTKTADSSMRLLMKNIGEGSAGLLTTIHTLKREAEVTMDELFNRLESEVQSMGEERCGLESTIDHYVNETCQLLSNTHATAQGHSKEIEAKAVEDIESTALDMEKAVMELTQELDMKKKSLDAEISTLELESSCLRDEYQLALTNQVKWSHKFNEELKAQEAEVLELFDKKMIKDLPTGLTPVRQEYPFSKVLSFTSPHATILKRYNSKTASTLSRIPLPTFGDDTEDEMSSSSAESSQLEELGETGSISSSKGEPKKFLVPNPPVQREDSGIPLSRSSSSSSLHDFKENKENSKLVHSGSTKKRELKPPSLHPSTSLEKLAGTESAAVRPRRILGLQN